jgi:hypothetical protein
MDERIGVIQPNGQPRYPAYALNGKEYDVPPHSVHFIGANQFVVLDNLPAGFDIAVAVAELGGLGDEPTATA